MLDIVNTILQGAKEEFKFNGVNSLSDADFLLAFVLGVPKSQLYTVTNIDNEKLEIFNSLVSRRILGEPMDSILGSTEYLGLNIPFSKNVLTPRQETEIMVDNIIREHEGVEGLRVLDLCSGSGCIGLSMSKHLHADVTLADISQEAMLEARKNALINNVQATFIISNLFDNITGKFDIIISNPPYIPTKDINSLEREVVEYDPILALDGGVDGLDFYRRIVKDAPKYLQDGGKIYMEFGIGQGEQIYNLMSKSFKDIEIFRDYSGIERYIKGIKK